MDRSEGTSPGARQISVLLLCGGGAECIGLRSMLTTRPDVHLLDEPAPAAPVAEVARRESPALILLGTQAIDERVGRRLRDLREASPRSRIVVICRDADQEAVCALARTAADGCVTWGTLGPGGIDAVLAAHSAGYWIGDVAATHEMMASAAHWEADAKHPPLAERERGVLRGLRDGLSEALLAARLGIGERTVQDIVQRLKHKFGAETVAHLIHLARGIDLEEGEE